jgi:predicted TIM-barrel fold metal-dependent hydrolase
MPLSSRLPSGIIDTHVHVFRKGEGLVAARRYTPDADALPGTLLAAMDTEGVATAILVQPSFLGEENGFLLAAIADHPDRFRGIAVVPPDLSQAGLVDLRQRGILGIRLNLIGKPVEDFAERYRRLIEALAAQRMVLQIQAEGHQWLTIAPVLASCSATVLIDHFGRTMPGDASGGFEALMAAAATNAAIWFKLSAPYRLASGAAEACAKRLLTTLGSHRLVWGSDWPATQFEGQHCYRDTLIWLSDWVPDSEMRTRILAVNPRRLYGFEASA